MKAKLIIEVKEIEVEISEEDLTTKPTCPECGEILVFEGGCNVCKACGWSKCD